MYPGSHMKSFLLGNTVRSPADEPFIGTAKGPQSIALVKEKKKEILHIWLVSINV